MLRRYFDAIELLDEVEFDPISDPLDPPKVGRISAERAAQYVGLVVGDYRCAPYFHADVQHDLEMSRPTESEATDRMMELGLVARLEDSKEIGQRGGRPNQRMVPTDEMVELSERVPLWRDKVGLHRYMRRRSLSSEQEAMSQLIRIGLILTEGQDDSLGLD